MTPAARYGAAIGVLDGFLAGEPGEKLLSNWARSSRYAGSKDRAAVRDIVFDCLRNLRSYQWTAGFEGGRALAVGHCLALNIDPETMFGSTTYAPSGLSDLESAALAGEKACPPKAISANLPDWLEPYFKNALGGSFDRATKALQSRASVDLRVNLAKSSVSDAQAKLAQEGIKTDLVELSDTALRVVENPRRVAISAAFKDGLVELQDAASQAVVDFLPLENVETILDYCAGGGGKSLAMAARAPATRIDAYDQNQARLGPLSDRAKRAGAGICLRDRDPADAQTVYDLVLVDAPCSGSGAWRRNPEGKWRLTSARLAELCDVQQEILSKVKHLAGVLGAIAYVSCSVLLEENEHQIAKFIQKNPNWRVEKQRRFCFEDGGDGFFVSVLRQE